MSVACWSGRPRSRQLFPVIVPACGSLVRKCSNHQTLAPTVEAKLSGHQQSVTGVGISMPITLQPGGKLVARESTGIFSWLWNGWSVGGSRPRLRDILAMWVNRDTYLKLVELSQQHGNQNRELHNKYDIAMEELRIKDEASRREHLVKMREWESQDYEKRLAHLENVEKIRLTHNVPQKAEAPSVWAKMRESFFGSSGVPSTSPPTFEEISRLQDKLLKSEEHNRALTAQVERLKPQAATSSEVSVLQDKLLRSEKQSLALTAQVDQLKLKSTITIKEVSGIFEARSLGTRDSYVGDTVAAFNVRIHGSERLATVHIETLALCITFKYAGKCFDKIVTTDAINKWNRQRVLGRAAIDDKQNVSLDFALVFPLTEGQIVQWMGHVVGIVHVFEMLASLGTLDEPAGAKSVEKAILEALLTHLNK